MFVFSHGYFFGRRAFFSSQQKERKTFEKCVALLSTVLCCFHQKQIIYNATYFLLLPEMNAELKVTSHCNPPPKKITKKQKQTLAIPGKNNHRGSRVIPESDTVAAFSLEPGSPSPLHLHSQITYYSFITLSARCHSRYFSALAVLQQTRFNFAERRRGIKP